MSSSMPCNQQGQRTSTLSGMVQGGRQPPEPRFGVRPAAVRHWRWERSGAVAFGNSRSRSHERRTGARAWTFAGHARSLW